MVQPAPEQHRAAAAAEPRGAPTRRACDERTAEVLALHRARQADDLREPAGQPPRQDDSWHSTRSCSRSWPAPRTRARCCTSRTKTRSYNPRLKRRYAVRDDIPIMLIDEAETVDDAEHDRLTRRPRPRASRLDVRRPDAVTDSLGLPRRRRRAPRAARAPHADAATHRRPRRCLTRRRRQHRRARHGRLGDLRRRRSPSVGERRRCRSRSSCSSSTACRASSGPRTLAFAVSYSGDTEETVSMATRRRRSRRAARRGLRGRRARPTSRPSAAVVHLPCAAGHPDAARRARRAASRRCSSRSSALGLLPEAPRRAGQCRSEQLAHAARRSAVPEVEGAANPARELARRIGRTIPLIYGGGALGAVAAMRWKATSTRTPRRRRSGTRTPSSTTTRSAGGASTAT